MCAAMCWVQLHVEYMESTYLGTLLTTASGITITTTIPMRGQAEMSI